LNADLSVSESVKCALDVVETSHSASSPHENLASILSDAPPSRRSPGSGRDLQNRGYADSDRGRWMVRHRVAIMRRPSVG
jgi:hypothetical protein